MSESRFFSGVSVVIPVASDEDLEWLSGLVAVARTESSEILVVLEQGADSIALRPATGGFERTRIIFQDGTGKASALNTGLNSSKFELVIFLDVDVALESGQISIVRDMFEDPDVNFVGVPYGRVSFPILSQTSGWFFAARRNVFIAAGGWREDGFNEDVRTGRSLQKQGFRIYTAPFAVQLRRPVKNPVVKLLSALFGR